MTTPALEPLNEAERAWLNAYHARVADELRGQVDAELDVWLDWACQPI